MQRRSHPPLRPQQEASGRMWDVQGAHVWWLILCLGSWREGLGGPLLRVSEDGEAETPGSLRRRLGPDQPGGEVKGRRRRMGASESTNSTEAPECTWECRLGSSGKESGHSLIQPMSELPPCTECCISPPTLHFSYFELCSLPSGPHSSVPVGFCTCGPLCPQHPSWPSSALSSPLPE